MKIQRLKLVNFIGIKHGLDLDEIEIDFTKSKNKIIMLLGGNGAGKSVIMSMLHPFKESFDERKNLILDGKVGEKEIDIIHNGHLYEIKHTYTKSAQSFIKKDGVELNENGGVRSFDDEILKEFGITKDYLKIGKIGSNTKNFVDETTSKRKEYIVNFLDIEDMVKKHAVVNEKLKNLNRDRNTINIDLGKLPTKEVVEATISQISESFETNEQTLCELYNEKGSLNATITHLTNNLSNYSSIPDLQKRLSEFENEQKSNKLVKESIEAKNPELSKDIKIIEDEVESLKKEIADISTSIQVKSSELDSKTTLSVDFKNKINAIKIELDSFGDPESIKKYDEEISSINEKIKSVSTSIKENEFSPLVNRMLKAGKNVNVYIDKTSAFLNFVEKYFTDLKNNSLQPNRMNIEMFFDDDFEATFKKMAESSKKLIESKKEILLKLQKDLGIKSTHVCQLENLKKRPKECSIDTCPFIKDAYQHRNVESEITKIEADINTVNSDIESLNIKQENLQECQSLYLNFKNYYGDLNVRNNDIISEFLSRKSLPEWVSGSLSDFQSFKQDIIEGVKDVLYNYNEYKLLKGQVQNLENTKKLLEDKDSTLKEKYESDIEEYSSKKKIVDSEIEIIKGEILKIRKELSEKQQVANDKDTYAKTIRKLASLATSISTNNKELNNATADAIALENTKKSLSEVLSKITTCETFKYEKSKLLDKSKADLARIKSLNEKLEMVEKNYGPLVKIEEALSPKKGIPTILMRKYLDETEFITNELLDIAFNGDFKIKFIINDSDFLIQVQSKGNVKSDIRMASQGEIAITTISISLALIEQTIGGYNILCLDEIDGNLDFSNRNNFMDILNGQVSKLGIEQVFVISHNDAFDTAPVGMVLLKGHNVNKENQSFMENKDIIFDLEEVA